MLKDTWLRRAQQASTLGGWGGEPNQWVGATNPTQSPPPTWTPAFTPLAGDFTRPTNQLRIEDVNLYGVAPEVRSGILNWLQSQGWEGRGSVGQYGYRDWYRQSPYEFNQQAFENIPDANLRQWAMRLFGRG
ncbi:MAG: hypothetical protein N2559_15830 [Anaerolineae bacterium]|nr:hypothetical protein [Anaerolineae bacterium]